MTIVYSAIHCIAIACMACSMCVVWNLCSNAIDAFVIAECTAGPAALLSVS